MTKKEKKERIEGDIYSSSGAYSPTSWLKKKCQLRFKAIGASLAQHNIPIMKKNKYSTSESKCQFWPHHNRMNRTS